MQPGGGTIDSDDVGPDRFAVLAARQHEMEVVGLRAPQIVDHQVAAVLLDCLLEALDRRQQIREIIRPLGAGQRDPAPPEPVGDFGDGTLFVWFALFSHATTWSLDPRPDRALRLGRGTLQPDG